MGLASCMILGMIWLISKYTDHSAKTANFQLYLFSWLHQQKVAIMTWPTDGYAIHDTDLINKYRWVTSSPHSYPLLLWVKYLVVVSAFLVPDMEEVAGECYQLTLQEMLG